MAKMKPSSLKHFTKTEEACPECNHNPCECKSMMLGDMIREMLGKKQQMTLNGRPIDTDSISIEGIDRSDRPDFVDAYISYAEYADGTPLTDAEVGQLSQEQGAWINTAINSDTRYL